MVVDCGGGTVDITVHEMDTKLGKLQELYKATGGPYGAVGIYHFAIIQVLRLGGGKILSISSEFLVVIFSFKFTCSMHFSSNNCFDMSNCDNM